MTSDELDELMEHFKDYCRTYWDLFPSHRNQNVWTDIETWDDVWSMCENRDTELYATFLAYIRQHPDGRASDMGSFEEFWAEWRSTCLYQCK